VYKPAGVFLLVHTPACTSGCQNRVADNAHLHIIYVTARTHLGTNAEPCMALAAAALAATLLSNPQAASGQGPANKRQQRGRRGRCWWVARPSPMAAWACSAPNLPCWAVIENT